MSAQKPFRYGVVGVFIKGGDEVLVCERSNLPGSWQFPQGGLDEGESQLQALKREMLEELGTKDFTIEREAKELTSYLFPSDATFSVAKKFCGQKHYWFLMRFSERGAPDLEKSDGEFQAFKWVKLKNALDHVVDWKRDAYAQGLKNLGLA